MKRKQKLVFADTNIDYLFKILPALIEKLSDTAEIEAISDLNYFKRHMLTADNTDIMIVSEEMYDPIIKGQHIKRIIILTEEEENYCSTEPGCICCLC